MGDCSSNVDFNGKRPAGLGWLLGGELSVRPWLLLAFVAFGASVAGGGAWLFLTARAQRAEIAVLQHGLERAVVQGEGR